MTALGDHFVGRRTELEVAVSMLRRATDRERVVEIVGDAGIGKSALVDEIVRHMQPTIVARAALSAAESNLSWAGLSLLLSAMPATAWSALPAHHVAALERAIGRGDGDATEPSTVAFAFDAIVEAACAVQPLLIVVDDLHWLDHPTAGALAYTLRRRTHSPLAVLVGHRPEPLPLDLARVVPAETLTVLDLAGLTSADLGEVLTAACGVTLPRPSLLRLHEHTGGSPLYAIELGRRLADGHQVADTLAPSSLAAAISQRVAELPASVREVLAAAAVGTPAKPAEIAAVLDRSATADLLLAEQASLLRMEGAQVVFSHPLYRASVLAAMGDLERRGLHARFADTVQEAERQALHLADSVDEPDSVAAAALTHAAEHARSRGAWEVGAIRLVRAVQLTPDGDEERWPRTHAAALALVETGDPAGALPWSQWLWDHRASDPDRIAAAGRLLSINQAHLGHMADASATMTAAIEALAAHPAKQLALYPNLVRSYIFQSLAKAGEASAAHAALAAQHGDEDAIATSEALSAHLALFAGEPTDLERLLRLAAECDPMTQPHQATSLSEQLCIHDLFEEAERLERTVMEMHATEGSLSGVALSLLTLAQVWMRDGNWEAAIKALTDAIDYNHGSGPGDECPDELADLAMLCAWRGEFDAADRCLAQHASGSVAPTILRRHLRAVAEGTVALAARRHQDAARAFAEAERCANELGVVDERATPFRADFVEALVGSGELAEAERVTQQLAAMAARVNEPRPAASAAYSAGLLHAATGNLDEATAAFDEAARQWSLVRVPFQRARTLLAAGACDRRTGQRTRARQRLEEALAEFTWLGATPWMERTREELARLGQRGERDELTATEQQVATLVADGRTNAEVANTLFMSPKTVEHHLTRIFRKLGLRSRTELAAHLGRRTP